MADDLTSVLVEFHREVLRPDIEEIVSSHVSTHVGALRNEMLSLFDGVYQRLDRLLSANNAGNPT